MSATPPTQPPSGSVSRHERAASMRFGAYIMLVAGALVTTLCGGCTGVILLSMLVGGGSAEEAIGFAIVPLLVGGLPTAVGVFLLVQGIKALKAARAVAKSTTAETFD